jgi:hypothetical protein
VERSVFGQKVADLHNGNIPSGITNYFINAQTLAQGLYFIVVETQRSRTTAKLLVK